MLVVQAGAQVSILILEVSGTFRVCLSALPHDQVPSSFPFTFFCPPGSRPRRRRPSATFAPSGLAGFFLVDYTQTDGRTDGELHSLLSSGEGERCVGLFRLMNLGVSGESGLASKQIREKISVRR